jgi:hypothetical protein
MSATVSTLDQLLIADTDNGDSGAANRITVQKLFDDSLTNGTYTTANLSGTITSNRTVATSATITTGTIPNLTAGTTTSTAATITNGTITNGTITNGTITNGTIATALIPTLTAGTTTGTAGIFTSGTIGNLSTTLAGDFTISNGTGTLGTSGVTLGTYGSVSAIPFLTVNAKGIITAATTGTFSSTPADGSITFAKLSTSATEADNVASRTAKAWVNFNGTGTVGTRASFNVSSITDNGIGDYTVNFATAIQDANYAAMITGDSSGVRVNTYGRVANVAAAPTANALRIIFCDDQSTPIDTQYANVSIFR